MVDSKKIFSGRRESVDNIQNRGATKATNEISNNLVNNKNNITEDKKCPSCNEIIISEPDKYNYLICSNCGYHFRMSSFDRVKLMFDKNTVQFIDQGIKSINPLNFPGYIEKIQDSQKKYGIDEAVLTGFGKIEGNNAYFGVMDYRFIMGSMGSVVGEKLTRMIEMATSENLPVVIFSASGGARMQEGVLSLVQMSKVTAALKRHSNSNNLFISVLTDPTMGGVTASFALVGDIVVAEPNTIIGFAGRRVMRNIVHNHLPEDFQSSEFMKRHGFIDLIVERSNLKYILGYLLKFYNKSFITKENIKIITENKNQFKNISKKKLNNDELSAWEKVQIARHKLRPNYKDFIKGIFDEFLELHGDRLFMDDPSIVVGIGYLDNIPVTIICTAKGKNLKENIYRNFGMVHPEGYRKVNRLIKQAEKFNHPIICFIDTPGAYCGVEAEQRGIGQALGALLMDMSDASVPIIAIITGEGGSGGALALSVSDRVFMLENSVYSVISPEGCATILFKDLARTEEISEFLNLTANDLFRLGLIDEIIAEPFGGAHNDPTTTILNLKEVLIDDLVGLLLIKKEELLTKRYEKIRSKGIFINGN